MSDRVFVYGTLRRGASDHWRMDGAEFLGETSVAGTLVKIDWYPGLILGGETQVRGEVYTVDEKLLAKLDEFEGITNDGRTGEYARVSTTVEIRGESRECYAYEWQKGIADYEIVMNGNWLTKDASR